MEDINETLLKGISQVTSLMCLAARTAPKARGVDNLDIGTFVKGEKEHLARMMETIAAQGYQPKIFSLDAQNVREAQAVVIIGVKRETRGLDCGFCGFKTCVQCQDAGVHCAYDLTDLGIAVGSAVSVAADHRVDNRIMYSIGYAAVKYKLLGKEVRVALCIPLSASGKNIFFDRK